MEQRRKTLILNNGNPTFSQVINDCDTGFCFPTYKNETLGSVLKKLCTLISRAGASGYSGFSGIQGVSGETGQSGFSGFSGISVSGYSGYSGRPGLTGSQGPQGIQGIQGESGFSGQIGAQGEQGDQGISGYSGFSGTGTSGYSGYSGEIGSEGPSGYSGFSGIGESGFSGESGYSGYSGELGASGISGYSGQSGISGYSGRSGYSGYSGISGYSGRSGYSGSGISGYSGQTGPQGISGFSGFSGAQGPQGPIGPGGGESGFSGYSGDSTSGYSGFSGLSGYSGSGESGYSGFSGIGLSGYSGYSGESITGPSGHSGYSGSGVSGYSGYSGQDGAVGADGESGYSGYSGEQGPQGLQGLSGISGYSGEQGVSGYSGSGVSGYSGYSGESGTSGYSGVQGLSGISGYSGSGISGYSGYSGSGISGHSGFSGSGISGYSGFSGVGLSGISGYSGSGISGYSGFSGTSGRSGYSGYSGTSGRSGYSGSGISGYSGFSGLQGLSGTSGYSGQQGSSGISGYSGVGLSGTSGYSGQSGTSGYSGISGYSGQQGISGFSGIAGSTGISGYSGFSGAGATYTVGNTLFVSKDGNDGTALRERPDLQFLTITAALTAATTGDTIIIHPGSYDERGLVFKDNVNFYFHSGAKINATGLSGEWIFSDGGVAKTAVIDGYGEIIQASTVGGSRGCIELTAASNITVRCKYMYNADSNNGTINLAGASVLKLYVDYIKDVGYCIQQGDTSICYWTGGKMEVTSSGTSCVYLNNSSKFYGMGIGGYEARGLMLCNGADSPISSRDSSFFEVANTYLLGTSFHGLDIIGSSSATLRNCKIESSYSHATYHAGIQKNDAGGILTLDNCEVIGSSTATYSILSASGGTGNNVKILTSCRANKPAHPSLNISFGKENLLVETLHKAHAPLNTSSIVPYQYLGTGGTGAGTKVLADDNTWIAGGTGASGYSGYSGNTGSSGYSGYSGVTGSNGTSGYSGYSGDSGISGYSGYSGLPATINNDVNNRLVTAMGTGQLNAESQATFDGTSLTVGTDVNLAAQVPRIAATKTTTSQTTGAVADISIYNRAQSQSGGSNYALRNFHYVTGISSGSLSGAMLNNLYLDGATYSYTTNNIWSAQHNKVTLTGGATADRIINTHLYTEVLNTSNISANYYTLYMEIPQFGGAGTVSGNYWGLYQEYASAKNYIAGELYIGSIIDQGDYKLQVTGNTYHSSYLDIAEIAEPATPPAGFGRLYSKTDGKVYWKDDGGTEHDLTATGGGGGTSGYSGYSGVDGATGTSGYSGYSGTNGTAGASGTSGYSGYSGTNGTVGTSGYSGYSGTNGSNGASGTSGYSGFSGRSGYSGYSGVVGTSGYSGYSGAGVATNTNISSITFIIDGGGAAITSGYKGFLHIPFACTINSVTLLADTAGSISCDIGKQAYSAYTTAFSNSITASAIPTISTNTKYQDATLTGWTTSISADDVLKFNVGGIPAGVTKLLVSLKVTKT